MKKATSMKAKGGGKKPAMAKAKKAPMPGKKSAPMKTADKMIADMPSMPGMMAGKKGGSM